MKSNKTVSWILLLSAICLSATLYAIYNEINNWIEIAKWLLIAVAGFTITGITIWVLLNFNVNKPNRIAAGILTGLVSSGITYYVWGNAIIAEIQALTDDLFNYALGLLVLIVIGIHFLRKSPRQE